jgi:GNAT superfamily N-acetyltransferase
MLILFIAIFLKNLIGPGIPKHVVETSIANSLCFGLFCKDEQTSGSKQVGFGRLITDKATFAFLADVFVLKEHRGKGLSKWLMRTIQCHPELQNLRRWLLTTKDAHGLYEQLGWKKLSEDYVPRFMIRHNRMFIRSWKVSKVRKSERKKIHLSIL